MGDGQAWWPCDVDGLCQCGSSDGSTTSTATLPLVESCRTCSECVAIPVNPHNANDDHCAPCALDGQAWWPCDVEGLCQCGSSDGSTTSTATKHASTSSAAMSTTTSSATTGTATTTSTSSTTSALTEGSTTTVAATSAT